MILAIVGSRDPKISYPEFKELLEEVVDIKRVEKVVSGGAKGIDAFAESWAKENNKEIVVFKPEYNLYGKRAPLIRNTKIVDFCTKVVAFPTKDSRGTLHTIQEARSKNKRIVIIEI